MTVIVVGVFFVVIEVIPETQLSPSEVKKWFLWRPCFSASVTKLSPDIGDSLFQVSLSQNCLSRLSCINGLVAIHTPTHKQNLDRQVWRKQRVGRIPLFIRIPVILSAVSVLTLLLPYLSYSQPAKCAKWSQVSACPRRVNECMNNR